MMSANQKELQIGVGQSILEFVAAVPASRPAGRIGPDHLNASIALLREMEFLELIGAMMSACRMPIPGNRFTWLHGNALRNFRLRDEGCGELAQNSAMIASANLGQKLSRGKRIEGVHAD